MMSSSEEPARVHSRRRHSWSALIAAGVMLAALLVAPGSAVSASTGTASLTWTASNASGQDLTRNTFVAIYQNGVQVTGGSWYYRNGLFTGLEPGAYDVRISETYSNSRYIPEWADGSHTEWQQQPTILHEGDNTVAVELDLGGFIGGTVTGSGTPINAQIELVPVDSTIKDTSFHVVGTWGAVKSSPLPAGRYGLIIRSGTEWIPEDHNGVQTAVPTGPPIVVEFGRTTLVDVDLAPAGEISGTVYIDHGDGTRTPFAGASLSFTNVDTPNTGQRSAHTDAEGRYALRGISGRYIIEYETHTGRRTLPEFYGGSRTRDGALVVEVRDNRIVSGIDGMLDLGGWMAFNVFVEPAPGRQPVIVNAAKTFQRLDVQTGRYVTLPRPGGNSGFGLAEYGPLEPGTYRVQMSATEPLGNPDDPATPRPFYTGELTDVIVKAGEMTTIGGVLLKTDYYGPPPPGGFGTPPTEPGTFGSLRPARLLDTRSVSSWSDWSDLLLGPNETIELQVSGRGGVPHTGVAAAVMNITATNPSADGFITVYPAGTPQPTASNVNFVRGQSVPNLASVKLGTEGRISLTNNSSGTVHLIADVAGYHLDGAARQAGAFVSLDPARLLDTRSGAGALSLALEPHQTTELQVTGRGGIPASGVSSIVMNVTATGPSRSGFLTAYPSGAAQPTASNLNFVAGQTVPNLATVRVGDNGKVAITNNSAGTVHVIADAAGYYLSGAPRVTGAFVSLDPTRILDSRAGLGAPIALRANQSIDLQVTSRGGVPSLGVAAAVMNVTVTSPGTGGFITAYPTGTTQPTASNLNFAAGQTVPNLTTVKVGGGGKVTFTNNSGGTVHLLADIAGYYLSGTGTGG